MTAATVPAEPVRPRLRTRLALLYAGVVVASGAGLLALVGVTVWSAGSTRRAGTSGPVETVGNTALVLVSAAVGLVVVAVVAGPVGWWLAGRAVRPLEVLAGPVGWWLAGRAVRPLEVLAASARAAGPDRLPGRGEPGRYHEFAALSATLGDLYGRLDGAWAAQRRFVADASHELRTPLTVQRALIQVALDDPDADLRGVCEELLRLGERQERLIAALLVLAESQFGAAAGEPVDLAAATAEVLSARDVDGLRVTATLAEATVRADPVLLGTLIGNLVDNAVRHNVPGGTVEIATAAPGRLTVVNTGPVVPADALERIVGPFQRLDGRRSSGGLGLGLSIVRAIADAHGATLTLRSGPAGGLRVEVEFPPAAG